MKKLMHFLMLSCLKASVLIEKKLHIKLNIKENLQLKMHKSMCDACRRYEKQSMLLDEALRKFSFKDNPINVEEFKKDIKKKLTEN